MSTRRLALQRLATVVGVVAVLALGFGSIQAASAWTAASAPLAVAPVSIATLQAKLVDEHARSQALTQQLRELDARSQDLETALTQANDRITTDTAHATDLEKQLAAAAKKLDKLETSIAKAKKALAAQVAAARSVQTSLTSTSTTSSAGTSSDHEEEDEHEDEDGD